MWFRAGIVELSGREVKPRTLDIALLVLWGVLCSLQFFVRGENSYIRCLDEADGAHPTAMAAAHFGTNSASAHWAHYAVCGFDNAAARSNPYYLVQKAAPGWPGFVLLMVLQRIIAAVFMYLFVKNMLGLGRVAAMSAGLVYPFCYSAFALGTYHALAEPGIPMFAYALGRIATLRNAPLRTCAALVAGLAFGLVASLFAAQPFILVTFAFVLFALLGLNWRLALTTLLAFAVGTALADANTIVGTLRALGETRRGAVSLAAPRSALHLLVEVLRRALNEDMGLKGMLVAAGPLYGVSILSVMMRSVKGRAFYRTVAAFAFCSVVIFFIPFLFMAVPGLLVLNQFVLVRFYVSSFFFLTVLAAMAVDGLGRSRLGADPARLRWPRVALPASGLALSIGLLALPIYGNLATSASRLGLRKFLAVFAALAVLSLVIALILGRRRPHGVIRLLGLAVLPCFALATLSTRLYRDLSSPSRYSDFYSRPEYGAIARRIRQLGEPFRVGTLFPSTSLMPMYALPSGLETVDGYVDLYPYRHYLWWRQVIQGVRSRPALINRLFDHELGHKAYLYGVGHASDNAPGLSFAESFNRNLLSLAGCKYFFSEYHVADPGLRELNLGGKLHVYENPQALPRFFLVSRARVFDDSLCLLDSLASSPVDVLRKTAFLEARHMPLLPDSMAAHGSDSLTIDRYESDHVSLTLDCSSRMILIATNNWSRLWRCRIDGQSTPVIPVDFTFQGVSVPAGRHLVELSYEPR
jgi:hypothetical protein